MGGFLLLVSALLTIPLMVYKVWLFENAIFGLIYAALEGYLLWLCIGCFGQADDMLKELKESKSGYIYNAKHVPNYYIEVENTVSARADYNAKFKSHIIDRLTEYRDHLNEVTLLHGVVYITYPLNQEVTEQVKSWTLIESSSGEYLAFTKPLTFDKSKVTLAFQNEDGTYDIKSIDQHTHLLQHKGTALELPGYSLPLRVSTWNLFTKSK